MAIEKEKEKEKEGFASRWSRRKQEVANETAVEDLPEKVDDTEVIADEETLAEQKLEKLNALTDEDMPDIETLNEDSDFSGFMSTGVSETLRKMALRKLFHGKTYNIRDGLDEYDGDYTSFEKLDPNLITCDMKHMIEVEAKKLLAEEKAKEEALLAETENAETELEAGEAASAEGAENESNEVNINNNEDVQNEKEGMTGEIAELDTFDGIDDELDNREGEDV